MIRQKVTGDAELREVQLSLLHEAEALNRNVVQSARKGLDAFQMRIGEVAPQYLPDRYAPQFAGDIKVQTFAHLAVTGSIRVRVYAHGVRGSRDVRSVNAGRVRHPLFGNYNFWYATRARPGVVVKTFKNMRPEIVDSINEELANVARRVASA